MVRYMTWNMQKGTTSSIKTRISPGKWTSKANCSTLPLRRQVRFSVNCCFFWWANIQLMVDWWIELVVWIPGMPLWKGFVLRGTLRIPNHQVYHYIVETSPCSMFSSQTLGALRCLQWRTFVGGKYFGRHDFFHWATHCDQFFSVFHRSFDLTFQIPRKTSRRKNPYWRKMSWIFSKHSFNYYIIEAWCI